MSDFTLRRDRRKQLDKWGYTIIACCSALLALAITAVIITRPPARDLASGCLVAQKAPVQHVAVIDRTDPWKAADQALLAHALQSLAATTRIDERLTVVSFDGRPDTPPQPLFDRCRPPEGKDVNAAFATPAKADRNYHRIFAEPLAKTLEAVTQPANAPETHLVAFLRNLAATLSYQATADTIAMHVFSDMAENTPAGSFLGRRKQFDAATFTLHFKALAHERLSGITVEVHLVPTSLSSPANARRIKKAWSAAFLASGIHYTWRPL